MSAPFVDAPPVETQDDDSNEWLILWAMLLLLLRLNNVRTLTLRHRTRARDLLRVRFEENVARYAGLVSSGQWSVSQWQEAVAREIGEYTRAMAIAGVGALPNSEIQRMALQEIERQMPFLNDFATTIAAGELSAAAIAARTRLYGGAAWAMFFMAQGSLAEEGIVEVWRAKDDGRTCQACASLNGRYFLPGQPPFPGSTCYGRGNCRCERVPEFNYPVWLQLSRGR